MDWDIVATVVVAAVVAAAAVGTVYPVLPGSPVAIVAFLAWAWVLGGAAAWTTAIVCTLITAAGWSASTVLTGRKLRQQQVPGRSIAVAVACGVAGMFLLPVAGLFVGFGAGLLASEYARRHDVRAALSASVETLKGTGLGILAEFGMLCLACSVWTIGVIVHFAA